MAAAAAAGDQLPDGAAEPSHAPSASAPEQGPDPAFAVERASAAVTSAGPAGSAPRALPRSAHPPPNAGASVAAQVAYIKGARQRVIQWLAVQFKLPPDKKRDLTRVPELEQLMGYLASAVQMTPQLRAATYIDKGLQLIADAKYSFPGRFVEQAAALLQTWEAQNWGAREGGGGEDGRTLRAASLPPPSRQHVDHLPPPDHPIYGRHGIMHGVIISKSAVSDGHHHARTVYRRHPGFVPRDANVFGHNGLEAGAWWPLQIVALAHGAHGSSQGGIAGSARNGGAYSVVVSGGNANYHDLDDDRGDVILYSGSRSHANRDPHAFAAPPSPFTQALVASWRSRTPVRVLRSAGPPGARRGSTPRWAPSVGIRYDGLYRVVDMQAATNEYGGLYEQFKLQRLPGQTPLEEVQRSSPSAQQRRDFCRISEGY